MQIELLHRAICFGVHWIFSWPVGFMHQCKHFSEWPNGSAGYEDLGALPGFWWLPTRFVCGHLWALAPPRSCVCFWATCFSWGHVYFKDIYNSWALAFASMHRSGKKVKPEKKDEMIFFLTSMCVPQHCWNPQVSSVCTYPLLPPW